MKRKVLLPYAKMSSNFATKQIWARCYFNEEGKYNNYVFSYADSKLYGTVSWSIISYDTGKVIHNIKTYEEAVARLDDILIDHGYTLCCTDEDIAKYRILL